MSTPPPIDPNRDDPAATEPLRDDASAGRESVVDAAAADGTREDRASDSPPNDAPRKRDRGRFSSKRKLDAVLELLRGRDASDIARIHRIHRDTLLEWRDRFVAAGRQAVAGPATTPSDPRDREIARLRERVARLETDAAMLRERCRAAEADRSMTAADVEAFAKRTIGDGDRPVGLKHACEVLGVPRSTVYWERERAADEAETGSRERKRGPKTLWSDEELVARMREIVETSVVGRIGYRKVWERLRVRGIEASKARVLRLMRQEGLLAFRAPRRGRS